MPYWHLIASSAMICPLLQSRVTTDTDSSIFSCSLAYLDPSSSHSYNIHTLRLLTISFERLLILRRFLIGQIVEPTAVNVTTRMVAVRGINPSGPLSVELAIS